jgi:hypothetical protein
MFEKKKAKQTARKDAIAGRKGMSRDHDSYTVSKNVKVVLPAGKDFLTSPPKGMKSAPNLGGGAHQARVQNDKMSRPASKSESKANARGLKAANAPIKRRVQPNAKKKP